MYKRPDGILSGLFLEILQGCVFPSEYYAGFLTENPLQEACSMPGSFLPACRGRYLPNPVLSFNLRGCDILLYHLGNGKVMSVYRNGTSIIKGGCEV